MPLSSASAPPASTPPAAATAVSGCGGRSTQQNQQHRHAPRCNVYVASLPLCITQHQVRALAEPFGRIRSLSRVFNDTRTSNAVGHAYCFILFESEAEANRCVEGLHNSLVESRRLQVKLSRGGPSADALASPPAGRGAPPAAVGRGAPSAPATTTANLMQQDGAPPVLVASAATGPMHLTYSPPPTSTHSYHHHHYVHAHMVAVTGGMPDAPQPSQGTQYFFAAGPPLSTQQQQQQQQPSAWQPHAPSYYPLHHHQYQHHHHYLPLPNHHQQHHQHHPHHHHQAGGGTAVAPAHFFQPTQTPTLLHQLVPVAGSEPSLQQQQQQRRPHHALVFAQPTASLGRSLHVPSHSENHNHHRPPPTVTTMNPPSHWVPQTTASSAGPLEPPLPTAPLSVGFHPSEPAPN